MAILRARLPAVLVLWSLLAWGGGSSAADRHEGYYYPKPGAQETYIFAKGEEAQKLIIVALEDGRMDTLFRARAVFANLTAVSRGMPIMQELGVQDWFTFFDLAKMLGFT